MHELSIVLSIVDIADEEVRKAGAHRVESIELDIGQLAGVEWEALDFAWEAATRKTVLEGSERLVNRIAGRAKCLECGQIFDAPTLFSSCPVCRSYFSDILQGKELKVRSLVIV